MATQGCACGFRGHGKRGCSCTAHQLKHYLARLSGPLLDRFDLFVDVPAPEPSAMLGEPDGEASDVVRVRVEAAREALRGMATRSVPPAVRTRLAQAVSDWGLSGRGAARTVAVARTIAALAGCEQPGVEHVDEALSFRRGLLDLRVR